MAHRGDMAQVELVEPGDHALASTADDVDRARSAVRGAVRGGLGWVRRHRVLAGAVVVALVVAIALPVARSVQAGRERATALAALPTVVAPMPGPPAVAWASRSAPGDYMLGIPGRAWVRDDVLVLWDQSANLRQSLRAVDGDTGDQLWRASLTTAPDLGDPPYLSVDDPTSCSAPGDSVVVCLVPESWTLGSGQDDAGGASMVEPTALRLRTFDVATGAVVRDEQVADHTSVVALGGDVVIASTTSADADTSRVSRLDPATGAERWSATVPRGPGSTGSAFAGVRLLGDRVAVGWLGATHLFTADGTASGDYDTDEVWRQRGHNLTPGADGSAVLLDLDTGRRLRTGESYLAWIATDDGSEPDLLLLQTDDGLRALDATTSTTAWTIPMRTTSATTTTVLADGRIAVLIDGTLQVHDLRSGVEAWHVRAAGQGSRNLVTDGRHAIVLGGDPQRTTLAAYDLRDGRRAWTTEAPSGLETIAVVDHRLFGVSSAGIVAFTPGG
ncbi:outer membrane protein assembly factor BamB family protein [Cellulomonas sp. P5_C6]